MQASRLGAALVLAGVLVAASGPARAIVGGIATNNFLAVGMGVQVAPDWVMTVRHAALAVGSTYSNGFGDRTVAAIYSPDDAAFPANDFALLRLVPNGATGATYPLVASEVFRPGGFRPLDVTIVSSAHQVPRGLGLTVVQEAVPTYDDDGPGPLGPVPVNWLVSYGTSVLVEGGDSGGGLFLGHVRDSSVLLGLTSALLTDENTAPIGSAFVQPAAYRAWIESVMSTDLVDEQQLQWTSAVPEPATWALWAAGLAWLARRTRRA
jgi:hypothetical protein